MMINNLYKKAISLAVITLQLLWLAAPALAEYKPTEAKINYFKGQVEVQKSQGIIWTRAVIKMKLRSGDKISTEEGSEAEIVLEDGSMLKMKDKSLLLIERMEKSKKPTISVVNSFKVRTGKVLGCIRKMGSRDSKFTIGTPTAVAGIRGTTVDVIARTTTANARRARSPPRTRRCPVSSSPPKRTQCSWRRAPTRKRVPNTQRRAPASCVCERMSRPP